MNPILKRWLIPSLAMLSLVAWAAVAGADDDMEARTARASNGAGIRVGDWAVERLPGGSGSSRTPSIEGYFQKGLDMHLVWENMIGYWGETYTTTQSGLLGSTQVKIQTHLVPSLTSLRIYPFTRRDDPFEPYAIGGAGAVFGIVQQPSGGSYGPSFTTGLGLRAGGGFDWHWSPEFGMTAGARYEWATFAQTVGSQALYRGPAFDAGLTYRFQYR